MKLLYTNHGILTASRVRQLLECGVDVQVAGQSGEITGMIEGGPSTRRASKDAVIDAEMADFGDESPSRIPWEDEGYSTNDYAYPGPSDDMDPIHDFNPLSDEIEDDEDFGLTRSGDLQKEGLLNVGLDLAGLVPGIGEVADVANAAIYAAKGEHLLAGLSLISVIPAIGDIVGKSGKLALWIEKLSPKLAKQVTKWAPKVSESIVLLKKLIAENKNLILKVVEAVKGQEGENAVAKKLAPHLGKIEQALDIFSKGIVTPEAPVEEARDLDDPDFFGDEESEDALRVDASLLDPSVEDELARADHGDPDFLASLDDEPDGHRFETDEDWFVESKTKSLKERLRKVIRECVDEMQSEELQHSLTGFADMQPAVVSEEEDKDEPSIEEWRLLMRRTKAASSALYREWPQLLDRLEAQGIKLPMPKLRAMEDTVSGIAQDLQLFNDPKRARKRAAQAMAKNSIIKQYIPTELGGEFV